MVWVSVSYLFYQPMDEKIKIWTPRFPTKENPNMEKALLDWPIVLQYDIKAKYRLISRKFPGMKFFHPNVRLTNQSHTRFYPFDKPTKSLYFRSFVVCFVRAFSFQGHTKIALINAFLGYVLTARDKFSTGCTRNHLNLTKNWAPTCSKFRVNRAKILKRPM